ncbi:MAG: CDP-alcohol phosphatidyltransferase family protein [Waterburya sp.]
MPNIIGYVRFVFYLFSFLSHTFGNWQLCISLYAIAFILDEFDGRAARAYNQSSNFGAALDMVADRSATAGLCLILAQLYPNYLLAFIGAIALDVSSHYYLIYATGMLGKTSHKDSSEWSTNGLLKLYYGNKTFMDLLILGNEVFYILLYLNFYLIGFNFTISNFNLDLWQLLIIICLPIYFLKQATNILQLQSAAQEIAKIDLINHQ